MVKLSWTIEKVLTRAVVSSLLCKCESKSPAIRLKSEQSKFRARKTSYDVVSFLEKTLAEILRQITPVAIVIKTFLRGKSGMWNVFQKFKCRKTGPSPKASALKLLKSQMSWTKNGNFPCWTSLRYLLHLDFISPRWHWMLACWVLHCPKISLNKQNVSLFSWDKCQALMICHRMIGFHRF